MLVGVAVAILAAIGAVIFIALWAGAEDGTSGRPEGQQPETPDPPKPEPSDDSNADKPDTDHDGPDVDPDHWRRGHFDAIDDDSGSRDGSGE